MYGRFSSPDTGLLLKLTFRGFLAVRLMEFDYAGQHYSYHGQKLENALKRLLDEDFRKATKEELVVWGQAADDWKKATGEPQKAVRR